MKLNIAAKRTIIIIGISLILILCVSALSELLIPRYEEEEKIQYAYTSNAGIDYKVHLRPNIMYNERYLEKGRYYVFKYIDYINLNIKYDFSSTAVADLTTEYSVIAYLQGIHGDENEVLWSKEYTLIPGKTIKRNDSNVSIQFNENIFLNEYDQVKESIFLDSQINFPVVLNIVFSVHTSAVSKAGTLEDSLSPNLIIPIGSSVFKMEGTPEHKGEDKIVENIKIRIPINRMRVYTMFGVSLLVLILVILTAFIEKADSPDLFEKTIAGIFREYSERLAGMSHSISYQFSDVISVNSIEDMIKIADEIGQPVFYYKVDSRMERKIEFFVFDSGRIYYMAIFGEIKPEKNEF
jgi:hypothetical protein